MSSSNRITRAYQTARRITYNDDSKFIIFSDVHRGDNSYADDFASNKIYDFLIQENIIEHMADVNISLNVK